MYNCSSIIILGLVLGAEWLVFFCLVLFILLWQLGYDNNRKMLLFLKEFVLVGVTSELCHIFLVSLIVTLEFIEFFNPSCLATIQQQYVCSSEGVSEQILLHDVKKKLKNNINVYKYNVPFGGKTFWSKCWHNKDVEPCWLTYNSNILYEFLEIYYRTALL